MTTQWQRRFWAALALGAAALALLVACEKAPRREELPVVQVTRAPIDDLPLAPDGGAPDATIDSGALAVPVVPLPGGDRGAIQATVKGIRPKVQFCYEKRLLQVPGLQGKVTVVFTITPKGSVKDVSALGMDDVVAACVVELFRTIEFPPPTGGGSVKVSFPFVFTAGP